jgi:hypothetical protein
MQGCTGEMISRETGISGIDDLSKLSFDELANKYLFEMKFFINIKKTNSKTLNAILDMEHLEHLAKRKKKGSIIEDQKQGNT